MSHDLNPAGVRHEQAGEQLKQRGLAGAVWTEQRDELTGRGGQTDTIQRTNRAVAFDDIVEGERRRLFIRVIRSPAVALPASVIRT